eukprot:GFUD01033771.1.p1 GENE.GFUD01033771.1~~GFUD01033771.1.p1  ORF type:complete len:110 (+),score=7.78 GFUD01033771.1:38-331(+)
MFRSILLCYFIAYVSTTTGTDYGTDSDSRCKCNGIMVGGSDMEETVGECMTSKEGRHFCFVNNSTCQDLVPYSQFPGLYWSYEACENQSFSTIGLKV